MKKRKRSSRNKTLTQEEIWDDSALLESWEEAAEEYRVRVSLSIDCYCIGEDFLTPFSFPL